jgi:hypothetical protein
VAKSREDDVGFAIADRPPSGDQLTDYDRDQAALYLRLLDAETAGASWEDVARRILGVDPGQDRDRARLRYETHLSRARWIRDGGYVQLLR